MPTWKFAPKIKVRSISLYSVRMRENADQKKKTPYLDTFHTVEALDLNKLLAKLCLSKTAITTPFYVLLGHQKQH